MVQYRKRPITITVSASMALSCIASASAGGKARLRQWSRDALDTDTGGRNDSPAW